MSGHRWHSFFSLSIVAALAGCQSDGSGKYAWNPFSKTADKSAVVKEDSSFSLPEFARRKADDAVTDTGATPPMAAEQLERLLEQGQLALQENRLEDARKVYAEVLGTSPDNATAHHGMAMAADLSENWEDAEYHYRQALRIRPRDANLLCDIGYSYLLQNRYSEASRYLNHAVEISPQHENAQMNLALLDLRQGNRAAAEQRINQKFGSSLKASQILAQLESQAKSTPGSPGFVAAPGSLAASSPVRASNPAGASGSPGASGSLGESGTGPAVIPATATFEQIREIATRERLEAERRRVMQGIPQDVPVAALGGNQPYVASGQNSAQEQAYQQSGFDPRTGMPFSQQPRAGLPNSPGAGLIQPATAHPGMVQQNSPMMAGTVDSGTVNSGTVNSGAGNSGAGNFGTAVMPTEPGPQNPQLWTSAPAERAPQGYQQPYPAVAQSSQGIPAAAAAGAGNLSGPAPMSTPAMNQGNYGIAANMPASGSSPMMSGGAAIPLSPASPGNGAILGRVVPVHSSGTFQAPPVNGVSYGQPVGFGNTAGENSQMPDSRNSAGTAGMNSVQQMSLEGLNVGPGALFPIGQTSATQTVSPDAPRNGSAVSAPGTDGTLKMGNISAPGTNSMINGTMYGQPQSTLPAQEWVSQQQQQLQLQQQQSQRLQGAGLQSSGPIGQGTVSAAWPAARPPQSNPLESYDRQLQQLDNDYNHALQQMDRQQSAAPSRAQY